MFSAVVLVTTVAHATGQPTFVPHACSQANPRLGCGTVRVPEDPSRPSGRHIPLNVAIVRAAKRSGDPPMFHLEGGPGLGATSAAGFYLGPGAAYAATRDIVLVDQRGTGGSSALRCPALENRPWWQDQYTREDADACAKTLSARADLTQYSTERAAADLDDVRRALGAPRIDIWALS